MNCQYMKEHVMGKTREQTNVGACSPASGRDGGAPAGWIITTLACGPGGTPAGWRSNPTPAAWQRTEWWGGEGGTPQRGRRAPS